MVIHIYVQFQCIISLYMVIHIYVQFHCINAIWLYIFMFSSIASKLYDYYHIHVQFHKLSLIGILNTANLKILKQFKGNNSSINDAILTKNDVHHSV